MELYKMNCNRFGNPISKKFGPDRITCSRALASFQPYGRLLKEQTYRTRTYVIRTDRKLRLLVDGYFQGVLNTLLI